MKDYTPLPYTIVAFIFVKISNTKMTTVFGRVESQNPSLSKLFLKVVSNLRSSSIKRQIPSNVLFHQISSYIKVCFPSKVVMHQSLSSIKGYLPSKVVIHQRLSSLKVCLPSKGFFPTKVVLHLWSSSIKGCIPSKSSKVLFHQKSSST